MAVSRAASWGPRLTTKSYVLEMEADTWFEPVYRLPGHSLGAPEPETQDAVMIRSFTMQGGFIREREIYHRKAFHRAFTFPMVLAPGLVLWSALKKVANPKGMCRRDFYATYLCPEDSRYAHFLYYPQGTLDEILQTNMLVATTDDEEAATHETTLRVSEMATYYALGVQEQNTLVSAAPMYGAAWRLANCENCPVDTHQVAIVGGGLGGTVAPESRGTSDRFINTSSLTTGLSSGQIITDIFTDGDLVIQTWADAVDTSAGTATTGGLLVSTDGGVTNTKVTNTALYGITAYSDGYVAVGKAAAIYISSDGLNYTQVTNNVGTSSDHYTDVAFDSETGYVYMSGYNGSNSVAHRMVDNLVSDITSQVNAGAKKLYRVAVLSKDQIAFGGETGTLRITGDITDGANFTTVTVAGSTSDIRGLIGNRARVLVGAGTKIYELSRLTEGRFSAVTVNPGTTISGNILRIGKIVEQGEALNYALFTTSVGEIGVLKPHYPGA